MAAGSAPPEGGAVHPGGARAAAGRGVDPLPLPAGAASGYSRSTYPHTLTHGHGRATDQPDGERTGGAGGGRVGRIDGAVALGDGGAVPGLAATEPARASGPAAGFRGVRGGDSGRVRSFGRLGQFGGSCAFYGGPGFGRLGDESGRAQAAAPGGTQGGSAVAGERISPERICSEPASARVSEDRRWKDTLHIMRTEIRGTPIPEASLSPSSCASPPGTPRARAHC